MAAPIYQAALLQSGYDYQLEFDQTAEEPSKKSRNRKRKIIWFNPPFDKHIKTDGAAQF